MGQLLEPAKGSWNIGFSFFGSLIGCSLLGCGGSSADRPDTVPVSGIVRHNDQPVEGATVIFAPTGHQYAAAGQTNAEGRFTLRTFEPDDGAVPGDFRVTVRKVEVTSQGGAISDDAGGAADAGGPPPQEQWHLPGRYANASTSGLTASVAESEQEDFEFKLEGAAGPPAGVKGSVKRQDGA